MGAEQLPWVVWFVPLVLILDAILGGSDWKKLGRSAVMRRPAVYWGGLGALTAMVLALFPLEAAPFVYFQF